MKLRRAQTAARAALGQYDAVMRDAGGRNQGPPTAKLYVSNLDPGVTPRDIKELFELVGPLTKHELNFDARGRSKGTAEVVFRSAKHAESALKKYNNVKLDGRPMRIELVLKAGAPGGGTVLSSGIRVTRGGAASASRAARGPAARTVTGTRSYGGRGRGRGRGRARGRPARASRAALDGDLDMYMN